MAKDLTSVMATFQGFATNLFALELDSLTWPRFFGISTETILNAGSGTGWAIAVVTRLLAVVLTTRQQSRTFFSTAPLLRAAPLYRRWRFFAVTGDGDCLWAGRASSWVTQQETRVAAIFKRLLAGSTTRVRDQPRVKGRISNFSTITKVRRRNRWLRVFSTAFGAAPRKFSRVWHLSWGQSLGSSFGLEED